MNRGFVKFAAVTPELKVCDVEYNCGKICSAIKEASEHGAKVIVFPELALTGATCGDMYYQSSLLNKVEEGLRYIADKSKAYDALIFVGHPIAAGVHLYNCVSAINYGEIIGIAVKSDISEIGGDGRFFIPGPVEAKALEISPGKVVPLGTDLTFVCSGLSTLSLGVCIGEDIGVSAGLGRAMAKGGASVIINPAAEPAFVGRDEYKKSFAGTLSGELDMGFVYVNAGEDESTTDYVFTGGRIIAENGEILSQASGKGIIYGDIDVDRIAKKRIHDRFMNHGERTPIQVPFVLNIEETLLGRRIEPLAFVPSDEAAADMRCREVMELQMLGLKKRLLHTGCQSAVIGISGGLDSTLALLVTVETFDKMGLDRENIVAVTMPCFGTSDRTYNNAVNMIKTLNVSFREINIKEAVTGHFKDIKHDMTIHNSAYENAQARERTQILMDIANDIGGLVIGTGDLSELALGWCTYNGDHMANYAVNGDVPKTLIRYMVRSYAKTCNDHELSDILNDILDTPVSPELLPDDKGGIAQKTEDIVGPYELHDFFIYYALRWGFEPEKILFMAREAFEDRYDRETILKYMEIFYKRLFSQQFKRSCLCDGPAVGSVGVSPRGGLVMPSDACASVWLQEIEKIKEGN
ncbi:MAG: NAD(+) synthase [Lachnospiraceae bacterium]|nr:NAD(+) synthase [Lachnospiraceae bacterium]